MIAMTDISIAIRPSAVPRRSRKWVLIGRLSTTVPVPAPISPIAAMVRPRWSRLLARNAAPRKVAATSRALPQ